MIRHGCGATWNGRAACHCTACCRTFASPSAFDLHRARFGDRGTCLDPADVGLVLGAGGLWRRPAPATEHRPYAWSAA